MWLRIRRLVLAARWWISRVVRLTSGILANGVICIEIGHLFFIQEQKTV
jgi:tetrahydromethanopterin S-methyltransferase subunit F